MQFPLTQPGTRSLGHSMILRSFRAIGCAVSIGVIGVVELGGCVQKDPDGPPTGPLVIDEVMSHNDAAWVDAAGETDDWIELVNITQHTISLGDYSVRDAQGNRTQLPDMPLMASASVVLFADDSPEQGALHLGFKLSSEGDGVELLDADDVIIDHVDIPALDVNVAYARVPGETGPFSICRYATPEHLNGNLCGPPPPPALPEQTTWRPYAWAKQPFTPRGPLVLSELALLPASFVEVLNSGDEEVTLADYRVRIAALGPAVPFPDEDQGVQLDWGSARTLEPGERIALPVRTSDTADIAATEAFEGVVTIFDADSKPTDRVDFMRWPESATLTRSPDDTGPLRFCNATTRGKANRDVCDPLPSREVGDRLRHLYTPGDYAALAAGDSQLGLSGVKVVVDMQAGDAVHLLSTRAWPLHYTWVREEIDGDPALDRCDAEQSKEFKTGWGAFSDEQYNATDTRRYLLGNLDLYAGSGMRTLDFTYGDQISGAQMRRAFFSVMPHLDTEEVTDWSLRPAEPRQLVELRKIEGSAPIVDQNAPFHGVEYQPLTTGVTYGVLRFVRADELEGAALGPDVLVVTDGVPNDIPFVAGLVTEAFQTPLAHVNVLSQNRGTPNMALHAARDDERLAPYFDQLVRLEVTATDFKVSKAKAKEAAAFWKSREPKGPLSAPRRDLSVRGLVDLKGHGLADLPAIGAKAAQLAELGGIVSTRPACLGPLPVPAQGFAIPIAYYADHFEKSKASQLLRVLTDDAELGADPVARDRMLSRVRSAITSTPLDPKLLGLVRDAVSTRFGKAHVRFRSSSNTEDLPGFNGAGLYESLNGELDDPDASIEDAIRGVWASLWNARAYQEREYGHIDQTKAGMAVLVHPAFVSERANVIAITRNVLDPTRSDIYYMNAQIGEASVALPAPGVVTEQLIHHRYVFGDQPANDYQSKSSLTHGADVLTTSDINAISCRIHVIHDHFQALLDPEHLDRWFAMDVELKIVGDARAVFIKQARPYSFATADVPADCREF